MTPEIFGTACKRRGFDPIARSKEEGNNTETGTGQDPKGEDMSQCGQLPHPEDETPVETNGGFLCRVGNLSNGVSMAATSKLPRADQRPIGRSALR